MRQPSTAYANLVAALLWASSAVAVVTTPTPTPTNTLGATPGPELSVTPSSLSLACQGTFDIVIASSGEPGSTLEISSLTLVNGYSQGYYGTGFSWDTSHIVLPASLASGASLTIPIAFSSAGQSFPSRLELTVESNALSAPHLFLAYVGALCGTPTPTPTLIGDLGFRDVGGVVYDASQGSAARIAGALVTFSQFSFVRPGGNGSATTGADGRCAFRLYLHDSDTITFEASAAGFRSITARYGGYQLWTTVQPIDFPLEPLGSITATPTPTVTPTYTPTSCVSDPPLVNPVTSPTDQLVQTISGYSPGLFCFRGGYISISGVEVLLQSQSCMQGTFEATIQLQPEQTNHVTVCLRPGLCGSGGCRTVEIVHMAVTPLPTPTATPAISCVGDCDQSGSVTIAELVTMVNIVLGNAAVAACDAGDANRDGKMMVDEIVTAVDSALNGCR